MKRRVITEDRVILLKSDPSHTKGYISCDCVFSVTDGIVGLTLHDAVTTSVRCCGGGAIAVHRNLKIVYTILNLRRPAIAPPPPPTTPTSARHRVV